MASAAWERRNARARELGYASYYDYRRHDYGRRPASEAPAKGAELERLRGHRGPADLTRQLESGRVELVNVIQTGKNEYEVLVTFNDGTTRSYTVRGQAAIGKVRGTIDQLGPDGPALVGSPKALKGLGRDLDDELDEAAAAAEQAELEAAEGGADNVDDAGDGDDIPF